MLHRCELQLIWLDMAINLKKSCCIRIGPRCDTACANVCSVTGVFIVRSRNFKCSLDTAKRSFYRAANAIFGKVGRIASEDVTLQLLSSMHTIVTIWLGIIPIVLIAASIFRFYH